MEAAVRGVRANARGYHVDSKVMGIDLAPAHTGVVILTEHGHLLRAITMHHPIKRRNISSEEVDAAETERLLQIANEIVGYAKTFSVGYVGIEAFAFSRRFQAHQLGELSGVVRTQLWLTRRIVARKISITGGRLKVLGYGGSLKKKQIFDAVIGGEVAIATEHEADAWVAAFALFLDKCKRVV
jgi:Holliday junction resolvasome RuvABC endonuclease subunit